MMFVVTSAQLQAEFTVVEFHLETKVERRLLIRKGKSSWKWLIFTTNSKSPRCTYLQIRTFLKTVANAYLR